jgi:hypothetical protein
VLFRYRTLPLQGASPWSVEFKWHRVVWARCRCMNVAKALLGFCMTGALEAPSRSLDGTAEAPPLSEGRVSYRRRFVWAKWRHARPRLD